MKYYFQPELNIYRCEYEYDCSYWNFKDVSAPYWRFYWCSGSGGEIDFQNKRLLLIPEQIYLIPPNTRFTSIANCSFEQLYIHFVAPAPYNRVKKGIYPFPARADILEKVQMLKDHLHDKKKNVRFELILFSLIYDAILQIPANVFKPDRSYDARVNAIIELLNQNTSWVFSNEELAEKVKMSVNGFIRLFSKQTGISPLRYSRDKRIEKACLLLNFSEQSIDEIARKTGFRDRYYFSKVFKQLTQRSPAQFRKLEQKVASSR
jgi:AraC-like DNA-binding protein